MGTDGSKPKSPRYLDRIGFEPIILHEQINRGQTIIEEFEANADVQFAVVLVTPDDVGGKTPADLRNRARQNVILEWGYFAGKLGRGKVFVINVGDTELPSDLLGIAWYHYEGDPWKNRLAQELGLLIPDRLDRGFKSHLVVMRSRGLVAVCDYHFCPSGGRASATVYV